MKPDVPFRCLQKLLASMSLCMLPCRVWCDKEHVAKSLSAKHSCVLAKVSGCISRLAAAKHKARACICKVLKSGHASAYSSMQIVADAYKHVSSAGSNDAIIPGT